MSLKIYITVLKRKTSLDVIFKNKTSSSFSGLITARAEINSTRALPVIARAWLRHCTYGTTATRYEPMTAAYKETDVTIRIRSNRYYSAEYRIAVNPTIRPRSEY